MIKKLKIVDDENYIKEHLKIINNFLPVHFSPMEIEVLGEFMKLYELGADRFNSLGRKIVRKKLNLSFASLANYIRSLKKKGAIVEINGKMVIPSVLFPEIGEQNYLFKLKSKSYTTKIVINDNEN